MMTDREFDGILKSVFEEMNDDSISTAILYFRELVKSAEMPELNERLCAVQKDYDLMLAYLGKGMLDPKREEVYQSLLWRLNAVIQDSRMQRNVRCVRVFTDAYNKVGHLELSPENICQTLEGFVSDQAMLSLEPEEGRKEKTNSLNRLHFDYLNKLFDYLLISRQWSKSESALYAETILSPTIDAIDAKMMVSAIMLSMFQVPDYNKFACLVQVYQKATDEYLRQRALVGWAFNMDSGIGYMNKRLASIYVPLLKDPDVCRDLLDLQKQVFFGLDAEKDKEEIQKNIMPDIIKNSNFHITRLGITEEEEDSLRNILHPNADDDAMDEMEKSVQRMFNMQKMGSDVYFGGFSQMKRFGFFYQLANWFVPFSLEHPDMVSVKEKFGKSGFLNYLQDKSPFCDSDKYSFSLAMSSMIKNIPNNVLEALSGENVYGGAVDSEDFRKPAYIRRMYLQNLYRFYRLSTERSQFVNPFGSSSDDTKPRCLFLFQGDWECNSIHESYNKLGKFLLKRKDYANLQQLLESYEDDTVDYHLLYAYFLFHQNKWKKADEELQKVFVLDSKNAEAQRLHARVYFYWGQFGKAAKLYESLTLLHPDDKLMMLNYCISLLNSGEEAKSLNYIYKLNLQHPDDLSIQRTMGWAYILLSDYEKAKMVYQKLLDSSEVKIEDYINAGYCSWFSGDIKATIACFRKIFSKVHVQEYHSPYYYFKQDEDILKSKGITHFDMLMMNDVVEEDL